MPPSVNFHKCLIDVERSPVPGQLCFVPLGVDPETGTEGALPTLAHYGTAPLNPEAEVLGYLWEGPLERLEEWCRMQAYWLDRVNLRKGG